MFYVKNDKSPFVKRRLIEMADTRVPAPSRRAVNVERQLGTAVKFYFFLAALNAFSTSSVTSAAGSR